MGIKNGDFTLPKGTALPNHLALVCDGSRRWARSHGLSILEGHKKGGDAIANIAKACRKFGIHTFTAWVFSTENWTRGDEAENILKLIEKAVDQHIAEAKKDDVRVVHLGRKDRLPPSLAQKLAQAEIDTRDNKSFVFNVAIDYGGHDEILRAVQKVVHDGVPEDKIDEKLFASYLDTGDQPYPYVDLFIRPSGEQRTSGLLPWQTTYAEYYWETEYLPDFTPEKLKTAILDYSRRRRRFGANDKEEHLKFNPKLVANLELQWRHALAIGENERFRDLVIRYVKEHYGLSRDLAKTAGLSLARAIIHGERKDWGKAKSSLVGLYKIVQKTLKLAFEPKLVANFEVDLWRSNGSPDKVRKDINIEAKARELYGEIFRFSDLQARKAGHLWVLATYERDLAENAEGEKAKIHWDHYRWYLEHFYEALKERVA